MSRNVGSGAPGGSEARFSDGFLKSLEVQPGFREALGRLGAFINGQLPDSFGDKTDKEMRLYFLQLKYGYKLDHRRLEKKFGARTLVYFYDNEVLRPITGWVRKDTFFGNTGVKWTQDRVQALLYRFYEILYPGFAEEGRV